MGRKKRVIYQDLVTVQYFIMHVLTIQGLIVYVCMVTTSLAILSHGHYSVSHIIKVTMKHSSTVIHVTVQCTNYLDTIPILNCKI